MRSQIKQVLFLAIFGVLCTAFVIFVPWGTNPIESRETSLKNPNLQGENSDSLSGDIITDQNFVTETLSISLKDWLLSDDLLAFSNIFMGKHGWAITFLTWEQRTNTDLSLIAFDDFTGMKASEVRFQEDITPLFIPQIENFLDQHKNFLPIAFDPAVMIGLSGLQAGLEGLELVFSRWNPRSNLSSFSFGLYNDPNLADQNLLLAQQLEDFIRFNDVGAFSQWIKMNQLLPSQQSKLQQLYTLSSVPNFLLHRGLLGIQFWFRSFYQKKLDPRLIVQYYPYQYTGLPVRLYGFVINPNSKSRKMIDQFLLDYMDGAFQEDSSFLMSGMIPVFQNQFTRFCGENACELPSDFVVLENWKSKIQKFLNDRLLWKTIEKKVQPDLYLKNASL